MGNYRDYNTINNKSMVSRNNSICITIGEKMKSIKNYWEEPYKKRKINVTLTPYAIMELRARSESNGMTLSGYLEWLAHQPPKEVKK